MKHACSRCGRITTRKRCDQHRPKEHRPNSAERGYDSRWRGTRANYLAIHPKCERCGEAAQDVHHLDGLGPLGPQGHDPANLESLCHSCHSTTTASEQPAGWNAQVS